MWSRDHVNRVILCECCRELTEDVAIGSNNHQGWLIHPVRKARTSLDETSSGVVLIGGDCGEDAMEFGKKMGALASRIAGRGFITLLLEPKDPWDSAIADLRASVALLGGHRARSVAAVGFCVAACAALDVATQGGVLDAAVAAFPLTIPNCLSQGRNVRVPILSIFDAIEGWASSEAMSRACAQACRVVWRVAQVQRPSNDVSKTSFMCSSYVVEEILSWLTVHIGVTTGDWNVERLAKRPTKEDDWWLSVDGEVPTFFNIGLLNWEQARAQWKVKRNPPPPPPPPILYDTVLDALSSSSNSFVLPGRMVLEDVVSLLVDIWTDV